MKGVAETCGGLSLLWSRLEVDVLSSPVPIHKLIIELHWLIEALESSETWKDRVHGKH